MSNTLLYLDKITNECQRIAHETATFIKTTNNQFDGSWSGNEPTGSALRIRLPAQYTRTQGARVADVQDSVQQSVTLTRATQDHVAMRFNSAEFAQDIDISRLSELHIQPAMKVLISGVESDYLQGVTKKVWKVAGTAGTAITDLAPFGSARAKINQGLAPKSDRNVQLDSVTMGTLVNGLSGRLAPSAAIGKQYLEGYVSHMAMADFYENERVLSHSNSAGVSSTANHTFANGDVSITVNTTSTAYAIGTVFTVAGVYDCHPETKAAYPNLKQFTIRATSTTTSLLISPTVYISGARKNVCTSTGGDLSGANSGAVTIVGSASTTYQQGLMYHKDAFVFATAELPIMGDPAYCKRKTVDGISLRVWQMPDIRNDEQITRIDILYGYEAVRPDWACRLIGSASS